MSLQLHSLHALRKENRAWGAWQKAEVTTRLGRIWGELLQFHWMLFCCPCNLQELLVASTLFLVEAQMANIYPI